MKFKTLVYLLLCLAISIESCSLLGQDSSKSSTQESSDSNTDSNSDAMSGEKNKVRFPNGEVHTEQLPYYPGGVSGFTDDLTKKIKAQKSVDLGDVDQKIVVEITINKKGNIEDPKVIQGASERLNSSVIQATKSLKQFEPAQQDGKPTPIQFKVPIEL